MANKDDYLTYYREFFENFAQTVNPNDQLPVKLASYKLVNIEVVGGIIDWTSQYLSQKKCPPNLLAPLIKIIIEEIRKACKKQPILCGFNTSDNAYEPLKLMQTVMAKTNEVCLRYLDNSMLCSLPSPGTPYYVTSTYAAKNTRKRMEDRHVVIHDLNTMFNIQEASPSSYYAVFDGHAGHHAAAYSSAHLHQFLAENDRFISNPKQALLDAFCKTDALFIDKCRVENLSSGTTAVVALLRPKEKTLYIVWVGDSQAVLVSHGKVLQIVNPHKPSRTDERERIESEGGCVLLWGIWRVNGQLAVSRAIGDAEYKPHVIAIPDIREIHLNGNEDFLILACDGLWDFVSEECAAHTVYNLVAENPDDTDRISQQLVQLSKQEGSSDNISVIVVFLREPSKIAAEAYWANRNCNTAAMEAGLDNANNPFAISNGAAVTDNIISQKSDGLMLNLTDNYKQNGTDASPTADFYGKEKSNGKRTASEFDDDDFGPETDVDTVDDVMSPAETAKGFGDVFSNNNPNEGVYNPFMDHQEKAAMDIERELQMQQSSEFEEPRLAREETPTPPADAVHDVSGLVDNAAESDSEDEWNYIKGDEANKENISPQPVKEVAEVPEEEDDNMSQLNPNAAEFVPVSPTRSIPSPACRTLLNDQVISQSPRRPTNDIDIKVPNEDEFENEVKSRPSDIDSYSNGVGDTTVDTSSTDLMETLLNGKNIDEIPEFHPGSTPNKIVASDEFHFGPNAAPFTPVKLSDQSEAALSTKAVFGDESTATLGTSFNESVTSQDTAVDINLLNKESDPMSMSFYADKSEENPFDLNQVHVLPDNIDEFLQKPDKPEDNSLFDDTISDLPEHNVLGEPIETIKQFSLNNDDAIQVTDLDKGAYDDEKELASPLEPEKELSEPDRELLGGKEECESSETPEPTHENLLGYRFCNSPEKSKSPVSLPPDVELISPEPRAESVSPRPESYKQSEDLISPVPEAIEIADLLQPAPESLPKDVELLSPDMITSEPIFTHEEVSTSPQAKSAVQEASELSDLLGIKYQPGAFEADDMLRPVSSASSKSPLPEACELPKTPSSDVAAAKSPLFCTESPFGDRPESKSPVCELPVPKSPVCELGGAKSPISERITSPVCELQPPKSPEISISPAPPQDVASPAASPAPLEIDFVKPEDIEKASQHFEQICELGGPMSPTREDYVKPEFIEKAEEHFEEVFRPKEGLSPFESPDEDITSSLRDEPASPDQIIEASFVVDQPGVAEETSDAQQLFKEATTAVPDFCPFSTSTVQDIQQVVTADIHSFESSEPPPPQSLDLDHPLMKCMYPLPTEGQQIDIKTENITPEFAEPAIVTPSEESKQEEVPTAPLVEEPVQEPVEKNKDDVVLAAAAVATAATALGVAAVADKVSGKAEKEEKKPVSSITKKATTAKTGTSKTTPKTSTTTSKTPTSRLSSSPKTVPAKSSTAKPTLTATPRPTSTKPSPKPKLPTTTPRSTEKKPLTNGDTKMTVRSTLASKRTVSDTTTKSATLKSTTATNRLSPTKPAVPKPGTARPATAPLRTATTKTSSSTTSAFGTSAKPRPTSLISRTATSTTTKPATTTRSPPTKTTSPRTTTDPRPKLPTSTTLSKPRVPLTKTITKTADAEKQNKESANKLTASRSVTSATRTASGARTTTTTMRKFESKTAATTTRTNKTTTTTMKSTTAKKPAELVRNAANKTKTTKVEKPKENGVSTVVVTEEITINTTAVVDSVPQLIKDNSPLDNKLIIDNTIIQTNIAD